MISINRIPDTVSGDQIDILSTFGTDIKSHIQSRDTKEILTVVSIYNDGVREIYDIVVNRFSCNSVLMCSEIPFYFCFLVNGRLSKIGCKIIYGSMFGKKMNAADISAEFILQSFSFSFHHLCK